MDDWEQEVVPDKDGHHSIACGGDDDGPPRSKKNKKRSSTAKIKAVGSTVVGIMKKGRGVLPLQNERPRSDGFT